MIGKSIKFVIGLIAARLWTRGYMVTTAYNSNVTQ